MRKVWGEACRALFAAWVLFFCFGSAAAQQSLGTLRGQVRDELGGVIIGATVTATDAAGVEKSAVTDDEGRYVFSALAPGLYTIRLNQAGFAAYENLGVEVQARGADLDALPDDPDDLSDALQALAGPTAGSEDGAQIYVDGFTGGRLPPKESIREIRINRNPFSAEYDRLGYGRVEIFTKPGTDKFRGQAFFNFNDESLNSRSPFALVRAPYQSRRYGGNVSGPLVKGKVSYFLDFERRDIDDNRDINAVILDPALNPVPFIETIL